MMVASSQQSLPRRRAQRRRMKAVELQPLARQHLRRRRIAWSAKRSRRAKPRIVNQNDQNIWRTFRWTHRRNRRVLVLWVLCIEEDDAAAGLIRNWKYCPLKVILRAHEFS